MIKASCECGKVRFEFETGRKEITVCHCTQCRKTSGHLWAATRTEFADLRFTSKETLTWYTSSEWARRGFCSACGSSLFYQMKDETGVGIAAGCLDNLPDDFKIAKHIFTKDKGCYYDINDPVEILETY